MPAPDMVTPDGTALRRAAEALRAGRLVAFPTETVYGLGADATNDRAVADIFAAKGRPSFNPLIVHVRGLPEAALLVDVDDRAERVAETFWPGPLTLVLPRRDDGPLSDLVSAGLETAAIRAPGHPVARALLAEFGRPIAAPSANRSGHVSPTTPLHVAEEFPDGAEGRLALVLAAGKCSVGLESTVLDLSRDRPRILRPGSIGAEDLEPLIGPVEQQAAPGAAIQAPGMLESHYAPRLPVRLEALDPRPDEALLAFGPDGLVRGGAERLNLSPTGDLHEAAANLFAMLRALDRPGRTGIAVMPVPDRGLGRAINDRLRRAAAPR